jgi:AcrR family transcriptional regulator
VSKHSLTSRHPIARPRQVSTDDILTVAREVFLELGPAATTTEIARRVGLSQAALFKRFGTKGDLLTAALKPPNEPPFLEVLATGPEDAPLAPQLRRVGLAIAAFFRELIPCMAMLRATGVDHHKLLASYPVPPPVRAHMALTGWLGRAKEMGRVRPNVDVASAALVFLGALQSRAFLTHLLGDAHTFAQDDATYIDHLVDVLCNGIHSEEHPS